MNNGGPAFPIIPPGNIIPGEWTYGSFGMSLRDVFVASIAAGDWASQSEAVGVWNPAVDDKVLEQRAKLYGRMADAMIKEREK